MHFDAGRCRSSTISTAVPTRLSTSRLMSTVLLPRSCNQCLSVGLACCTEVLPSIMVPTSTLDALVCFRALALPFLATSHMYNLLLLMLSEAELLQDWNKQQSIEADHRCNGLCRDLSSYCVQGVSVRSTVRSKTH